MLGFSQPLANPMHGLHILLFQGVDRHKAHGRPLYGLQNALRIVEVILVGLHIRLDKRWMHELHPMSVGLKLARPIVRTRACLHADHTGGQIRYELGQALSRELSSQYNLTGSPRSQ